MAVLKYNDRKLAIFDFEKERATRQEFLTKLADHLGISLKHNVKTMLEACCANPEVFNVEQRHFLFGASQRWFDGKELSEGQAQYLASMHRKCQS